MSAQPPPPAPAREGHGRAPAPKSGPDAPALPSRLSGFLNSVADAGLHLVRRRRTGGPPAEPGPGEMRELCEALLSTLGEASGTALARRALQAYEAMGEEDRRAFFGLLRDRFCVDEAALRKAAADYAESGTDEARRALLALAEPPRQELFRRLNMAPDGTAALVDMRRALIGELRRDPSLSEVDADMRHLFASWFNRGFLTLRSIDWQTPAAVLEKLIEYETVHEMHGWDDLRRRLAADRRCFAFFHSALPNDPLVFVEVALVRGLSSRIGPILAEDRRITPAQEADTAVFYSINNCLEGLRGISFGNFLIKQVVVELARDVPGVATFATLSPVPGFAGWLRELREAGRLGPDAAALLAALDRPGWPEQEEEGLPDLLTSLAAHYLLHARRGTQPLDPVARFHLRNGARLERVNWLADPSPERLAESHGLMVNYVYDVDSIERNHETYVKGEGIAHSRAVAEMAASAPALTPEPAL